MTPSTTFRCVRYSCSMPARDCILRQRARYQGHGTWKVNGGCAPVQLEYCASGECEQGNGIKEQLAGQKIEKARPVDFKGQWKAKRLAQEASSILPPPNPPKAKPAQPPRPVPPPPTSKPKRGSPRKDLANAAGVDIQTLRRALTGKRINYASDVKLRPVLLLAGLAGHMAKAPRKPTPALVWTAPAGSCEWTEEPCGRPLRHGNETGLCTRHGAVRWAREHRGLQGKKWKWIRPSNREAQG